MVAPRARNRQAWGMLDATRPFVLLDDARPGGGARLYRAPVRVIRADRVADVPAALADMTKAVVGGAAVAGYLGYEAGAALVPGVPVRDAATPLLWFGVFDRAETVDAAALLPDPAGAWIGAVMPDIDRDTYAAQCNDILELIAAGDIYQANLTFGARVPVAGDPLALYAAIRPRAAAGHGAVVWTGSDWLLSFSPELFFAVEGGRITARPMKGTASRDPDPARDRAVADALANDPKQRAENLMIVDLMRNDLSRVGKPGSVRVPERFVVETYPSIHQLVSSVTAELLPGTTAVDALAALFPCGSITGAPKRRAMEAIDAVEGRARGIYTGAIGAIDAGGDATFNVAIRTLHLPDGGSHATIGLGSGVVADSDASAEWRECLAKARFLDTSPRRFDLVETMAFDPIAGIALLERHLARMTDSARALGFAFDRHATRNELQAATFRLREASRVRLLLSVSGAIAVDVTPLPTPPAGPVDVGLAPLPVPPRDLRLAHKTSDRRFWPAPPPGCFETIFVGDHGEVTEGSFTSIFVGAGAQLLTPPLDRGLLPGVLRGELIARGEAVEMPLKISDLAQGFYIGNAVRGLIRARLVADANIGG
ncbi:aminodeoxychorismate synthase component I [Sphingomonas sp. 2R-10]|uniref:aminodeoxychorismate synthase component I n=1 Tax=Sphingomonas sp. 2R-10 TaxID=3045148 RepID=UPI0019D26D84|nr:aminodeoxychorismate synthase component I [Sphingomonas sp. 2R-10]MDJ0276831.1 aminodeoxychorismate synthase component I [Sphingomonas sp. 2R-10]